MSPAFGALLGVLVGFGVLLAWSRLPAVRRPRLSDRMAPYLRDTRPKSRLLAPESTSTPFSTLERIVRPFLSEGASRLDRWLGGSTSVRRRLDRLGNERTVEEFRLEQLLWGLAGLGCGIAGGLLLLITGRGGNPIALALFCLVAGAVGVLMRDRRLTSAVDAREARMMTEFPTVAELLALSVGAGEGAIGALERVTSRSRGELARELGRALADARSGVSVVTALERMADRSSLPALSRFVDGMAVAIERGTPLADVLRAQAVDVREAGKRALLETGARREIAMMVPVVFLVLPISVVFALFPGFYGLSLSAP
jgi:tight adherence protein C